MWSKSPSENAEAALCKAASRPATEAAGGIWFIVSLMIYAVKIRESLLR
jgi:hypothetical protein